jgi:hypothetical protein
LAGVDAMSKGNGGRTPTSAGIAIFPQETARKAALPKATRKPMDGLRA